MWIRLAEVTAPPRPFALLASLLILLISAGAHAATVGWHAGTDAPPTAISPNSPTDLDTVSFTAAIPLGPFSNSCVAVNALGSPSISANLEAHEFKVTFSATPFPPHFCPQIYAPVNGIDGELGMLEPGDWTLTIRKLDYPYINITLPFSVAPTATRSGELSIHSIANAPIFPTLPTRFTIYTPPTYTPPIFTPRFIARPLGRRCNPGNGGTLCGSATLQRGVPLAGTIPAKAQSASPVAQFTLPRSALIASASGSLPSMSPYLFVSTLASSARNDTGFFAAGRGPGSYTFGTFATLSLPGRVRITAGANQFGGTMRLLGALTSTRAHAYRSRTYVGSKLASFKLLGGRCSGVSCPLPAGSLASSSLVYRTSMSKQTTAAITEWGFPWTTGMVSVAAGDYFFASTLVRTGFDHRTALGFGSIQLVAPQLVHWNFPKRSAPWDRHTGAIGVLRIKFVPEPSGWVMLVSGAAFLSVGYARRKRRHLTKRQIGQRRA